MLFAVYEEPLSLSLEVQSNSRPVRSIELSTKVCTVGQKKQLNIANSRLALLTLNPVVCYGRQMSAL